MMQGLSLPFVVLPSIGGVAAGWLLTDWRLAGALVAGGLALVLLGTGQLGLIGLFALPVIGGAATGALALMPYLYFRPDASVWSRMTLALAVTFAVHFVLLLTVTGQV